MANEKTIKERAYNAVEQGGIDLIEVPSAAQAIREAMKSRGSSGNPSASVIGEAYSRSVASRKEGFMRLAQERAARSNFR